MKKLKEQIKQLAIEELERANEKFPQFASSHEGYAIVLEEFEEAKEEVEYIGLLLGFIWQQIKANDETLDAKTLENHAIHLAAEAIQCAAMSMKFQYLLEKDGGKSNES